MVRPRVARGLVNLADAVLHQCIRPLIGACCAPGHHGYQRAFDLISGQASNGPFGSPVFACAGKTDPPLLSQSSRRPRRVRVLVTSSIVSSLRPVPLFVPGGRSFVPACARREDQAGRDAISSVLTHSKARPLLRTAQAIRASLLASAIASTLWCNRFLAASIQDLRQ